jgi:hypothetical protein
MNFCFCSREDELAAVIREGRWPQACDPELRAHVDVCGQCSDLATVAQTLQRANAETVAPAYLSSPGTLWWRAQLRRDYEAYQRMNKPIVLVERLGFLSLLATAVGLAVWQCSQVADWTSWLDEAGGWSVALLIAAIGTLVLLGVFAISLLTEKE